MVECGETCPDDFFYLPHPAAGVHVPHRIKSSANRSVFNLVDAIASLMPKTGGHAADANRWSLRGLL
jgi:hypothetical protein